MKPSRPVLADVSRLLAATEDPKPGSPRYEAKKRELLALMTVGMVAAVEARQSGDAVRAEDIEAAVLEAGGVRKMLKGWRSKNRR